MTTTTDRNAEGVDPGTEGGHGHGSPDLQGWDDFAAEHADWLAARAGHGPVYALPRPAITALETTRPSVMTNHDTRAERALEALCRTAHAVGVLGGRAIAYPYLDLGCQRGMNEATRALLPEMGWKPAQYRTLDAILDQADSIHQRLKGVAGWLALDPTFRAEVANLTAAWNNLPVSHRPAFPILRPPGPTGTTTTDATDDTPLAWFARRLTACCDRWDVCGLATWDLPLPQGPRLPALDGAGGVHLVIPIHYPMAGDDALLRQVHDQQRQEAAERGLDPEFAGLAHHGAYGQLLEVAHLQDTIRAPYGRAPKVGTIVAAASAALGLSIDRVLKLRKAITACRRGRRGTVPWLRPRVR